MGMSLPRRASPIEKTSSGQPLYKTHFRFHHPNQLPPLLLLVRFGSHWQFGLKPFQLLVWMVPSREGALLQERERHINLRKILGARARCPWNSRGVYWPVSQGCFVGY